MNNINLREIADGTDKPKFDILLDLVKDYPNLYTYDNFTFEKRIDKFNLSSTRILKNTDGVYGVDAQYNLTENIFEDDVAVVFLRFYKSKNESHQAMRDFIDGISMMTLYASDLDVGDFAIGGRYRIDFIRGNVFVTVQSFEYATVESPEQLEIDALAYELDKCILHVIS